jgi:hypothetical protein
MTFIKLMLGSLFWIAGISLNAQDQKHPESVQSVENIVQEVLNVISVDKGEKIDVDRFRSLFLPDAKFTVLYHSTDSMPVPHESVSLEEFLHQRFARTRSQRDHQLSASQERRALVDR